jgi:hypothetical protein
MGCFTDLTVSCHPKSLGLSLVGYAPSGCVVDRGDEHNTRVAGRLASRRPTIRYAETRGAIRPENVQSRSGAIWGMPRGAQG